MAQSAEVLGMIDDVAPGSEAAPSATADQNFFQRLDELVAESETDAALDLVFDTVDDLLLAGRFKECDRLLREVDLDRIDAAIMVGFLTITAAAAQHLPGRSGFVGLVKERLRKQMTPEELAATLDGLE